MNRHTFDSLLGNAEVRMKKAWWRYQSAMREEDRLKDAIKFGVVKETRKVRELWKILRKRTEEASREWGKASDHLIALYERAKKEEQDVLQYH
jgi:hypothetical protein